ncbi:hypothetical protein M747DRAFT_97498 [Aspergillus niger ATCC 13496]|uniref:Uncharacterized protein n=1 Tax=Aspergillus niger ATCC 13496 TaxID=1353008 RepID=A0A370BPZ1_ASPNG|nr:hypothetical protein M747DRAFT_97498 [Aspergillus niger ATCC 13496]
MPAVGQGVRGFACFIVNTRNHWSGPDYSSPRRGQKSSTTYIDYRRDIPFYIYVTFILSRRPGLGALWACGNSVVLHIVFISSFSFFFFLAASFDVIFSYSELINVYGRW